MPSASSRNDLGRSLSFSSTFVALDSLSSESNGTEAFCSLLCNLMATASAGVEARELLGAWEMETRASLSCTNNKNQCSYAHARMNVDM